MLRRISACTAAVAALLLLVASPAAAAFTETIDESGLTAISCVPTSTTCVVSDDLGELLYATDVGATDAATWNEWAGPRPDVPGPSPALAIGCPASSLCVLGAGDGDLRAAYKATSLGGDFTTAFFSPNLVGAISCPSTSFCVTAQNGGGFIRYSTAPTTSKWTAVSIGTGAMRDVTCLSPSFCAAVDDSGNVHVAVTEQGVKENGGRKATNVNGGNGLHGVACTSTSSCLAVDGSGDVLELAIAPDGSATVTRQPVAGAGRLVAISCSGLTCAAADADGALFGSTDGGASWAMRFGSGPEFTGVSCASASLCAGVTRAGTVTTFDPSAPCRRPSSSSPTPSPPASPASSTKRSSRRRAERRRTGGRPRACLPGSRSIPPAARSKARR